MLPVPNPQKIDILYRFLKPSEEQGFNDDKIIAELLDNRDRILKEVKVRQIE